MYSTIPVWLFNLKHPVFWIQCYWGHFGALTISCGWIMWAWMAVSLLSSWCQQSRNMQYTAWRITVCIPKTTWTRGLDKHLSFNATRTGFSTRMWNLSAGICSHSGPTLMFRCSSQECWMGLRSGFSSSTPNPFFMDLAAVHCHAEAQSLTRLIELRPWTTTGN